MTDNWTDPKGYDRDARYNIVEINREVPDYNYLDYVDRKILFRFIKNKKELSQADLEKLLYPIRYDPIRGCWFRREDWSVYSTISINKKLIPCHVLMYELYIGPIINNKFTCHKCDRKGCCNPWHLFLGTAHDNHWDAVRKKRKFHAAIDLPLDNIKRGRMVYEK